MITILHNPRCSTSRKVLDMIRETGTEPEIVEYLKHPLGRKDLVSTLIALELGPRDVMRTREPLYRELGLSSPDIGDSALLDQLVAHPRLIERPIVVTAKGARLCRPAEKVLEIL